ncbi:hypothetical protein [Kitasatospora sp. NPDC088779]|uniref:hypothetical protein n=1 Tax=unclassified Kitasatospora TaxID=2633591 RepID=UPI00342A7485
MTITASLRSFATTTTRRLAVGTAVLAVAGTSLITSAGGAQANPIVGDNPTWINGWSTYSDPYRCSTGSDSATFWCLYYNSGAEGAVYKSNYQYDRMNAPYAVFQSDRYGSRGAGQRTWHNAASVENPTSCNLGVSTQAPMLGDTNWVPPMRGGNLTNAVKNKNEAAGVYCD